MSKNKINCVLYRLNEKKILTHLVEIADHIKVISDCDVSEAQNYVKSNGFHLKKLDSYLNK